MNKYTTLNVNSSSYYFWSNLYALLYVHLYSINTKSVDWLTSRFLNNYALYLYSFQHSKIEKFYPLHLMTPKPKVLNQRCPIRSNTKCALQEKGIEVLECSNFDIISSF